MLSEDGRHLYVDGAQFHDLIEQLAVRIHQSGWEFDAILCLARGGMRPGDILSRIFQKAPAILSTSSYRGESGTEQGSLDIARWITTPRNELSGRVLLVDDLADSGATLQAVLAQVRTSHPAITELRSAVLWIKASSGFVPDYTVQHLATNPWIHQPFESYDRVRPAQLVQKWSV